MSRLSREHVVAEVRVGLVLRIDAYNAALKETVAAKSHRGLAFLVLWFSFSIIGFVATYDTPGESLFYKVMRSITWSFVAALWLYGCTHEEEPPAHDLWNNPAAAGKWAANAPAKAIDLAPLAGSSGDALIGRFYDLYASDQTLRTDKALIDAIAGRVIREVRAEAIMEAVIVKGVAK